MTRRIYALLSLLLLCGPAAAQDDFFFIGAWRITSASAGPWVESPHQLDEKAMKARIGTRIQFERERITGPGLFACDSLRYGIIDSPPEGLFQGAFDEMRRKDARVDPAGLAASLGFRTPLIRTLQTGCANELDYHFIDDRTSQFALDNYIYTLKRSRG